MYQDEGGYYSNQYHDDENYEESNQTSYGYNYRNYRSPAQDSSIKGKIEQKYWKSKQKVIEKLGKGQDEFVIAGDAEVDARLEAFHHIKITCMHLMAAIECYQNKIFALSQDENEMGRFLRDQGATDKTKAGKMMIAVGKAQSYAAQQRLALRAPLVRLFAEIETFRFRAIQDTQITVEKMEQSRTDYRARLLWMADISKELDPDQNKRLDKFRDVQFQVKAAKKLFDKLKGDVVQKIDLLSASRCNLLSATLEPYQTSMLKFLQTTAASYNSVSENYQGYPSYQFQILKHILPNNGIADEDEDDILKEKEEKKSRKSKSKKKVIELAKEATEDVKDVKDESSDDKLISFDSSPTDENQEALVTAEKTSLHPPSVDDLLGGLSSSDETSPGFGEFTDSSEQVANATGSGFDDLLGKFEENNVLAASSKAPKDSFSLLGDIETDTASVTQTGSVQQTNTAAGPSVDDLLFGVPQNNPTDNNTQRSDLDLLSDVLTNQSLGLTDKDLNNSFSSQWNSMFGAETMATANTTNQDNLVENPEVETDGQMFMPSFLMDQMRKADPMSMQHGAPKDFSKIKDSAKVDKTPPTDRKNKKSNKGTGKDMSAWFNLFADLDPLSNPDDIGAAENTIKEKQAC